MRFPSLVGGNVIWDIPHMEISVIYNSGILRVDTVDGSEILLASCPWFFTRCFPNTSFGWWCSPDFWTIKQCSNKLKFTWVFPKIGVPPNHPFTRVFHYKPSILGYPYFWKHLHGEASIFEGFHLAPWWFHRRGSRGCKRCSHVRPHPVCGEFPSWEGALGANVGAQRSNKNWKFGPPLPSCKKNWPFFGDFWRQLWKNVVGMHRVYDWHCIVSAICLAAETFTENSPNTNKSLRMPSMTL